MMMRSQSFNTRSMRCRAAPKQRGFSLVELMVSMVIALLVMAGVINSFLASRTAFFFNEELAFIQDNARYATEIMTREIRNAGYFGCDRRNAIVTNSVNSTLNGFIKNEGIEGFEGGVSTFPPQISAEVLGNTDAVIVRSADQDNSFAVESHKPNSATIKLVNQHTFAPGTVFVISDADCRHQGIFVMSGPSSGTLDNVVHNSGAKTNPSNCSKSIKGTGGGDTDGNGSFDCNDGCGALKCDWTPALASDAAYGADSTLFKMSSKAFYISQSALDATMPALFVRSLSNAGTTPRTELAPGIEDFQLTFGVDTNGDFSPDQYMTADNVGAANWAAVGSVRIEMVARSQNEVLPEVQTVTLLNNTYTDRYLRQLITTTITVRNYTIL